MKKIGDWFLLETEKAQSFVKYAKNTSINNKNEYRKYNEYVYDKFIKYCDTKRIALDIGASYGFVTRCLADSFDHVYSYEIVSSVRKCLKTNMQNYSNVHVEDFGISSFVGKQKLFFYPSWSGHSTTKNNKNFKEEKKTIIEPVKKIDALTFNGKIDFIKIDVEGSELSVLKGANKKLSTDKPVLLVEILSVESALQVMSYLQDLNYVMKEKHKDDYVFVNRDK